MQVSFYGTLAAYMGDGGGLWAVMMVGSISTKQEGARGVRSTRMETFYSPAAKRRDEILGEWVLGTRIPRTRRLKKNPSSRRLSLPLCRATNAIPSHASFSKIDSTSGIHPDFVKSLLGGL